MNKPIIKFATDFGPLLIFFILYFYGENDLKVAIPPFIIATLVALVTVYFLEKRIPMVPLLSGVLITFFGGLTLYFDNKIFFYMKPTIINLLFAGVLFFGQYVIKKNLLKMFFKNKLILKGNFSEDEMVEMSIYQVDKDKKSLQVISDRARPFIKNFDFIEGFEGGKLEYESIISKEVSNSNLTITDFKVSKVPALAQLLTLASLQGIADTLSGEGIRFESFEMKSNSEGNVLNIEDVLAIGPAVSILLEGYIDKGKTVSLRGTLVPATKLNSIIASIPVVGDILVGKKAGEGVVGVSFKMKGPPKNIKTTINFFAAEIIFFVTFVADLTTIPSYSVIILIISSSEKPVFTSN